MLTILHNRYRTKTYATIASGFYDKDLAKELSRKYAKESHQDVFVFPDDSILSFIGEDVIVDNRRAKC